MLRRVLDSPLFYFTLAAALVVAAVFTVVDVRVPSRPTGTLDDLAQLRAERPLNVVFVLIDTLRADRLGVYGYERDTSPFLDQLAQRAVRFARVEAQSSWTKASMASLWTGMVPTRSGVTRFSHALPPDATTPAEILRDAGYTTVGIFRNGWVAPNFGFGQGFETYVRPSPQRRELEKRRPGEHVVGTDEDATNAALSFLETHGHTPFLLYLHYMDVHQYAYDEVAARKGFGTAYSDAYDASIHWVDRNVAAVVSELERREFFEHTIVVVASDHGEGFYEHGQEGHARTLYREVTWVPWILALPVRLPQDVVVPVLARNVDIWPTLLDLLGLPPLPEGDGISLVPAIFAAAEGRSDAAVGATSIAQLDRNWGRSSEPPRPMVAVRDPEGRTLIVTPGDDDAEPELFDGASDPFEQQPLDETAWSEELLAEAEASLALSPTWGDSPEVEIDELHRGQLKALGYVIE